ncbi:sigma 54-interacting transcriptional regulator [Desulfobacula sp.]|uniref:sigma-54 interaction domain-containing protein n=1 Tax=Desulfobacula sp. TaxID=2593537 RepID=UPI0026383A82|nr:sigma 54-interacting transcriptional regulator [Desulfobacula sp.]
MSMIQNNIHQNRFSIQTLCNILKPVLGIELMVIDQSLIAIAGTGPYEKNVGSKRPRESYVDISLKSGETFHINTPRETEQCLRCELRSHCVYTSVISCPLLYSDQTVGLFGFLGYDGAQRKTMEDKNLFLASLTKDVGKYIVNSFWGHELSYSDFISSSGMNNIINSIEEGIIITDSKDNIINVNQFAEKTLNFNHKECLGRGINIFGSDLEIDGAYPALNRERNIHQSKYVAKASLILYKDQPVGQVLRLQKDEKRKTSSKVYSFNRIAINSRIIGISEPILKLKKVITKVAVNNSKILITGETGTGKELIARLIHYKSPRYLGPFITLNCGALPETLIESELFGYEKGAFTGSHKAGKVGKFELADKGTIFLDEIGNLSLTGQAKILRILDNNILEKIGSVTPIEVDIRLISATNKDLPQMVKKGIFLEDLYYRLNVVQLVAPPLRERKTDIPLLLDFFIKENNLRFNGNLQGFTSEAMIYLIHLQWHGNVRELKNVIEYACNVKNSGFAGLDDLPPYMFQFRNGLEKKVQGIINTEKLMVEEAIRIFGNSTTGKQKAAKYLGISVSTLYRRLTVQSPKEKSSRDSV